MMQLTELEVWKSAIELAKLTYQVTEKFPEYEDFGLTQIVKRNVTDIPANISAAASRKSGMESLKHLYRSRDLLFGIESHYHLAFNLGYLDEETLKKLTELLDSSKRLLFGFIKYYKRQEYPSSGKGRHRDSHESSHSGDEIIDEEIDFN